MICRVSNSKVLKELLYQWDYAVLYIHKIEKIKLPKKKSEARTFRRKHLTFDSNIQWITLTHNCNEYEGKRKTQIPIVSSPSNSKAFKSPPLRLSERKIINSKEVPA